jgi:hypothetical protein
MPTNKKPPALNGTRVISDGSTHDMLLFDGNETLASGVSRMLCIALDQGHGAVAIATLEHQKFIDEQLSRRGIDVTRARQSGQYRSFDAVATLADISVDGVPDAERFEQIVDAVLQPAIKTFARVCIFGEMVALLWGAGKRDDAVRLEKMWNDLVRAKPVVLHCAYPHSAAADPEHAHAFNRICIEHCEILAADGSSFASSFR